MGAQRNRARGGATAGHINANNDRNARLSNFNTEAPYLLNNRSVIIRLSNVPSWCSLSLSLADLRLFNDASTTQADSRPIEARGKESDRYRQRKRVRQSPHCSWKNSFRAGKSFYNGYFSIFSFGLCSGSCFSWHFFSPSWGQPQSQFSDRLVSTRPYPHDV